MKEQNQMKEQYNKLIYLTAQYLLISSHACKVISSHASKACDPLAIQRILTKLSKFLNISCMVSSRILHVPCKSLYENPI